MKILVLILGLLLVAPAWSADSSDLKTELKNGKFEPIRNKETGELEGMKVIEVEKGSIYDKLGIKPGDVVRVRGDEKEMSPERAMELYNQLKENGKDQIIIDKREVVE